MANQRSPSSSRCNSPDDDYTDSFEGDEDQPKRNMNVKNIYSGPRKKVTKGRGRGQGRQTQSSQEFTNNITRKMMSAKKLKINELRNRIEELNSNIEQLGEENKLLKKMQHRQEKALVKFEHEESDLPRMIQRHSNETRNFKEQLRRTRDKYERTDRYLRDAEDELDKVKNKLKKYKTLAEDKRLPEREELNKMMNRLEIEAEEKDLKIRDLEKHVTHLNKNHRHELGIEMARNRETRKQLEQTKEEKDKLQHQIIEKEKELEIKNIYANRMISQPRNIPASYGGTPNETPQPPNMRKRAPSLEVSPRHKMKQYEEKRREESRKQIEIQQRARHDRAAKLKETKPNFWTQDEDDPEQRRKEEEERNKQELEEWEKSVIQRRLKEEEEEEARTLQQERERIKRESDNRLEMERRHREEQEKERQSREMRGRRLEQEQRENREHEEREREREREREEREEREETERQELEKKERQRAKEVEEQEKRARAERERLQFDTNSVEERRRKDEILAKLREIDDGQNKKQSSTIENPFFVTTNISDSNDSTPTSKKGYTFTRPIQNMHQGLPSHDDITVPYLEKQKHKKNADLDIGGYQPSYGSGKRGGGQKDKPSFLFSDNDSFTKNDQKSNLMNDLFGSDDKDKSKAMNGYDEDIFSAPNKKTKTQRSSLSWDEEPKTVYGKRGPHRENSSTVFGGGSALVDDDENLTESSKLLLRRQRQPATMFQARPAVTAVDNMDDDIEEVIL